MDKNNRKIITALRNKTPLNQSNSLIFSDIRIAYCRLFQDAFNTGNCLSVCPFYH